MFRHLIIALTAGLSFASATLAEDGKNRLDRTQTNSISVESDSYRSSEQTPFGSRTSRDDRRIFDSGDYYDGAFRPN
ncbi:hypothetical protein EDE05_10958 [Neorhizobium sp. R1-B]|jgi:hypothetical protein|uniref:hypothetical protein n=1 Tax=Neorhizobium sp. R1-B TaxID=2485162 RepID=UPI0010668287|nr:hypothetical protein [Neorhizobium sp. R1-B]TDX82129.1 hypothetical protein EDE05_10958 [Neorhizobium sp. R1-B]